MKLRMMSRNSLSLRADEATSSGEPAAAAAEPSLSLAALAFAASATNKDSKSPLSTYFSAFSFRALTSE